MLNPTHRRKFFFPVKSLSCKPVFRYLVCSVLLFTSLQLFAADSARKQIYNRAVELATSDVAGIAKQEQWSNYQVKMNVFIPTEANTFSRCKEMLQASRPQQDKVDLVRLRYDIRCETGARWEIGITVKPDIYLPVVVAKHALQRGVKVAANDIELKKRNISSLAHHGYITSPDEAMGLTVKKRIRNMQPIALSQLELPILVERGQQVTLLAGHDSIEIRTLGEALKKGRKGDLVKVRNLGSGKTVTATVVDLGVVKVM